MSRGNFFSRTEGPVPSGQGRRNHMKEEELIVRRRNAEFDRHQLWTGVNDYFKTWDVRVNQFSNWASPEFYNSVGENRSKEIEAQNKKENLEKRRICLSQLLAKENAEYNEEIKNLNKKNKSVKNFDINEDRLSHMNLELIRKADEAVRREDELRLYHHYTFPHPDQFRKQYAYFAKKATNEEKKKNAIKIDKDVSNLNNISKKWDSVITNDKLKAESEVVKSSNLKLTVEAERRIKELEKIEGKKNNLKSEKVKNSELISNVKRYFKEIMNEYKESEENTPETYDNKNTSEHLSSSCYLKEWRKKSKNFQSELKQQILFLENVIKLAEEIKEFYFKYEVEKKKQTFLKKLQMESGREQLSNLFECSYREPSIWWKEENKMWKEDKEERMKHLEEVYSKLENVEDMWNSKINEEMKRLVTNQENIISDLERLKKDIENNEKLLEQLHISNRV